MPRRVSLRDVLKASSNDAQATLRRFARPLGLDHSSLSRILRRPATADGPSRAARIGMSSPRRPRVQSTAAGGPVFSGTRAFAQLLVEVDDVNAYVARAADLGA
jgi:hypothetical protein